MFLMNGNGTELIRVEDVQRFCVVEKNDACLIVASYGVDGQAVTVGRYQTREEAVDALSNLAYDIGGVDHVVELKPSTGTYKPVTDINERYHGRKPKNHGGS